MAHHEHEAKQGGTSCPQLFCLFCNRVMWHGYFLSENLQVRELCDVTTKTNNWSSIMNIQHGMMYSSQRTYSRFVTNRQETAAKFTLVNRDKNALPLWPHKSSVFQQVTVQRHNCIKPQEQTWRLREIDGNCHDLWRLDTKRILMWNM